MPSWYRRLAVSLVQEGDSCGERGKDDHDQRGKRVLLDGREQALDLSRIREAGRHRGSGSLQDFCDDLEHELWICEVDSPVDSSAPVDSFVHNRAFFAKGLMSPA
jgi:hypothetical protein